MCKYNSDLKLMVFDLEINPSSQVVKSIKKQNAISKQTGESIIMMIVKVLFLRNNQNKLH